eukprot:8202623-Ditylum_brightwellii.AAC.1
MGKKPELAVFKPGKQLHSLLTLGNFKQQVMMQRGMARGLSTNAPRLLVAIAAFNLTKPRPSLRSIVLLGWLRHYQIKTKVMISQTFDLDRARGA